MNNSFDDKPEKEKMQPAESSAAAPAASTADAKSDIGKILVGPNLNFASTEAYNLLRTNLMYALPEKETAKILGITSPCPQEGKSFTSINTSYSLAEAGNRVLLIDCDMRRPSVAKTLRMKSSPGLSQYLIGEETDVIRSGIMSPNLDIIFAGDIPPNPSELLGSAKMRRIISDFANEYDFIILDLPPVNSVADPIVASRLLDGVVVVVRHAGTRASELKEAIRQLRFAKVKILGFVYNGFSRGGKSYRKGYRKGYYKRGYYYYSSSSSDGKSDKKKNKSGK